MDLDSSESLVVVPFMNVLVIKQHSAQPQEYLVLEKSVGIEEVVSRPELNFIVL